ncbi:MULTISPECIES: translation initiation factor IF-2 [unclassified Pseudodesulfovibrio]|uniref:translation initiation factor IF-2 n=1 Tax=unclassified Pseudodesulfovibrio TaxID=2661612 RepID=UPI000FEBBCCD|nr:MULTISPECIES: translation initiation factor IF-2 [unclassified Pseudodesulfovibrio]MCJ2163174.1 translation initiation factor IF-2 [Pseudodesulfovibrio sp. S3-i]RWU07163.1 translation initiation factor IF-2 [Pseudodesulfovibrio sp. S3]
MTAKVRVEDLAAELNLSNKEIIQQLREIGVQAKSQKTVVEDEDVDRLKAELKNGGPSTKEVRRVGDSGVIIRRRGKKTRTSSKEEESALVEETVEETVEVAQEPEVAVETAAPEEKTEEIKPAKKKAPKQAKPQVKVIRPAVVEEPVVEPVVEETVAVEASVKDAVVEEAAPEPVPAEPVVAPEAEDKAESASATPTVKAEKEAASEGPVTEETATAEPKKKKKKKKEPEAPKVKIISMPTEAEVQAREAAKLATPERRPSPRPAGRPGPGRPGPGRPAPGRPAPGHVRPGPGQTADPVPDPNASDGRSKKKKGKKDRRVVEFATGGNKDHTNKIYNDNFSQGKGRKKKGRKGQMMQADQAQAQPMKAAKRKIKFDETIRLADMAHQMGIKAQDLIKALFGMGVLATINQSLDLDTASLLASEFGYEVENVSFDEQEFLTPIESDKAEDLKPRPPVVTIMGHVDHGKTSLLDAIRLSNVTDGEAGGITQHIGAYHVQTDRGEVVFLDTPGHEAFTTMRMRGAQVTDIVILVVAADDGVMDQTREAISHSKAAGVPIVVAVNKMDKEGANPDNVKRELAELGLSAEDWGGETIFAYVSAKQKTGLDELLEMVLLQAEVLELKANPDKHARGHIVEARLDKGRGPVGTMLISEGTLNQGDSFVSGVHFGKVRAMFNDQGKKIKSAGPAMPVEIQGFDGLPEAGDELFVVDDEKVARRIAQSRAMKKREKILSSKTKVTLESFLASKPNDEAQSLNLVLKADVQGSLEAVTEALNKLSTDEVRINVVHGGAGAITESDILLAGASEAIILGFNVRPNLKVKQIAEQEGVEVRFYDIIYKLVQEVKDAMSGMLTPDIEEVYLGQTDVRATFSVPKIGLVAGCFVVDGKITRGAKARLLRDGVVIYTGHIASLRREKDDVREVAKGYECGIGLEKFNDVKVGDSIEAFETKEVARTID